MKKYKGGSRTLFRSIVVPLVLVMIFQSVIFFGAALFGGVVEMLNKNSEDVLKERTVTRRLDVETTFVSKWTNLSSIASSITNHYSTLADKNPNGLAGDVDKQKQLLSEVYPSLISALRSNNVTGVFLIINNFKEYTPLEVQPTQKLYGLCVRDYDPNSTYSSREDLLVTRCPTSMVASLGCSVDSGWEAMYTFDSTTPSDYYFKPIEYAYQTPGTDYDDLAFFCGSHSFTKTGRQVVSYSLPLIGDDGMPFAVLGVELTVDYLKKFIPASTLDTEKIVNYALCEYSDESNVYSLICTNGTLLSQAFASYDKFEVKKNDNELFECVGEQNGIDMRGYVSDIRIYNQNTPFEDRHIAVVGMVKAETLYNISSIVTMRILYISAIVLVIGIITVLLICRRTTKPINKLSSKVRNTSTDHVAKLDRINISEIDELVSSIEDLSEKVNRNMVRTEFFSRMSHDMRTPMNAIIGFSSPELTEDVTREQLIEYIGKIHSSGEYLLGLINEILDMTKIEARRMELRSETVFCNELWGSVTEMIKEVADKKGVLIEENISCKNQMISADKNRINQVLMNLLSNAVKFTPSGGTVYYNVKDVDISSDEATYCIEIIDTGCGMSDEFMKIMYEPFTQENSGNGGTGLGLAITRQIVELMQGTINCKSEQGKGTTFEIRLSLELKNDESKAKELLAKKAAYSDSDMRFKGKHILLCEDHELNLQIAQRLLERKGMVVETALNGKEGMEKFTASTHGYFNLILMDIRMPVMDGLQTAAAIRSLDRFDAKTVPIIAMTANAFAEDVEQSRQAGMNEHLSKPIDPALMYKTLEKYL